MRNEGTFFIVIFLVSLSTNFGFRYLKIDNDLLHVIVMSLLAAGILKAIDKFKSR